MKLRPGRRLAFDLETDGLLHQLTRVHLLGIRDVDTGETWIFRRNSKMDTIRDGIRMLNRADMLIGHNVVDFDLEALWKVYDDEFNPEGTVRDTMVMARMLFSDEKERDFRRLKRGELEGKYLGSHELAAWGQRLGFEKDDYSPRRKAEATAMWKDDDGRLNEEFVDLDDFIHWHTWGFWNQEMEDYLWSDLDATLALWRKIEMKPWAEGATLLEHQVHALMGRVQNNGFPFDIAAGEKLRDDLFTEWEVRSDRAKEHFGSWWVAGKWLQNRKATTYVNPETDKQEKNLPTYSPRPEYGEDDSREHWAEVVVPAKSIRYKKGPDGVPLQADRTEGAPYCPIKLIEFNPNSRPQIVDRLIKIYDWEPQEFTEGGSPSVGDEILRNLALPTRIEDGLPIIPIAEDLADIFYFKKRLGQLADGPQAWLKKAIERGDGRIHPRTIVGGTVTNRASHSSPNIAQVPRVVFKKPDQWLDEEKTIPVLGPDGKQIKGRPVKAKDEEAFDDDGYLNEGFCEIKGLEGAYKLDAEGNVETKKVLMKGYDGDHGWDCRNLFYVPEGWVLMGADQKGIELRALGHYMAEFDKGEYGRLVVEADPHDLHQRVMELDSRDVAKTAIYALIYGAQDFKLGTTITPALELYPVKAKALGAEMRKRLMTRIPALGAVSKATMREAKRGYVDGLDGRHLYVRAKHAALNTKLQGAAASIAKKWCVLFEQYMEDEGLKHGWDGDFAILAWVHDELQVAVRDDPRIREIARQCIIDAAYDAGVFFGFRLPVDVDTKFGQRWSDTH